MYRWRTLTPEERHQTLRLRELQQRPLHSPSHRSSGSNDYLITASCYEHVAHIGRTPDRITAFSEALLEILTPQPTGLIAWVVLPNHYHALIHTNEILAVLKRLGRLHGKTAFLWNGEEQTRGRKIWCNTAETVMKSEPHFWATVNYIHHNPVKHGYVEKWTDWPWSSAAEYLKNIGRAAATQAWQQYPIDQYGQGWDDPDL
jgi:putative transposase